MFFFAFVPWLYQKGHLREMTGNGMRERQDDMQQSVAYFPVIDLVEMLPAGESPNESCVVTAEVMR